MIQAIYIYNDSGVSSESLKQTLNTMNLFLKDSFHIKTISSKELKLGLWTEDAALFVIPGGADIPYTRKLNGKGNQIIKNYVANGGKYLGICAGSYYGSSSIEFASGTKILK